MKVERIEFKFSSPITEDDRKWNREQLFYLVKGVECVDVSRQIPPQYSSHTHSAIASAIGEDTRSGRTVERYANGASNIYFGKKEDGSATGFIRVRPTVFFLVHPDECFERWFTPRIRAAWHNAVFSPIYDEVVVLSWGNDEITQDNDIILEFDRLEAYYGRKLIMWKKGENPPFFCIQNWDKWRNWSVDVGGCFKEECVFAWTEFLENNRIPYNIIEELTLSGMGD